jgi:hypothetical protein
MTTGSPTNHSVPENSTLYQVVAARRLQHFGTEVHGPAWAARRNATRVEGPLGALGRIRKCR